MKDKFSQIKAKAKILNDDILALRGSASYLKVVGVLSGLGYLIAPDVRSLPMSKLEIEEAIKIGKCVEPRILEVLPAAVLSCPKSFLHLDKAPDLFKAVVAALKNRKTGPDFEGISFEKFYEVATRPTRDKRRKRIVERRISKTFRFSPDTVDFLTEQSKKRGTDQTAYIEMLIKKDSVHAKID